MKAPMPKILRRGAVIRVAGAVDEAAPAAPAYAVAFVDLQFDDGHVERWLGPGSLRDEDLVQYDSLVAWGVAVAEEHPMIADLGMAFSPLNRQALSHALIEVVVEWNAQLPHLD